MTALVAALLKFGPWVVGLLGVLFGAFRHQQAKADKAQAAQQVAEASAHAAQNDAALAQANQAAAQDTVDKVRARENAITDVAALPDPDRVLRDRWSR